MVFIVAESKKISRGTKMSNSQKKKGLAEGMGMAGNRVPLGRGIKGV